MGPFNKPRFLALAGVVLFAIGAWAPAFAQDADDQKRAVARLSLLNGEVNVQRGDSGDWVAAAVNAPLMTGDRIATGANSRAEVQFDAANVLRIGGGADVRLTQLEYDRYQMEVAQGTVTFTVRKSSGVNIEVDTPSVSVRPQNQGAYRIAVNEAGETQVTVRSGQVEVFTPRGSQWVTSGQMLMARGPEAEAEFQITEALALDDWDQWNQSRDRAITQSKSYQYVPQGVYGVEELDNHGTWVNADDYGWSWRPTAVAADWSPYSNGRWVWQDWYGWSWVSYDPWGWAPFHYGRWFHAPRWGWCWYPGAFGVRQYWSPGLVAFFGFGRGGGAGFGFGNVGWVPLAPFDPFHRWWGRGFYGGGGFNRNINITNINITNIYRNSRVRNGIVGIGEGDFRGGRFNNVRRFSGDQVRQAGLIRGQMPIAPGREHLRFSDRAAGRTPRTNDSARFFRRQQPNPVERVSFAQQQRAIEPNRFGRDQNSRGNLQGNRGSQDTPQRFNRGNAGGGVENRGGLENRGMRAPDTRSGVAQRPMQGGWRRFGDPTSQNPGRGNAPVRQRSNVPDGGSQGRQVENPRQDQPSRNSTPANRGPWQRFGDPGSGARPRFESSGGNAPRNASPAGGDQRSPRMAPPVVRERQNDGGSEAAPRGGFGGGGFRGFTQPRVENAPRQNNGGERSGPRMQGGPRGWGGGGSSPQMQSAPRGFGGGESSPRMQGGPRGWGGGGSSPQMQRAPRGFGGGGSAPRMQSSPRSFGGGGGGGGSRQSRGGGESRGGGNRGGGRR